MIWRDYIVYGLLLAFFGGMVLFIVYTMLSKSKGEWSEEARQQGTYRARHWKYTERVSSLSSFLLPESTDLQYWPTLASTIGYDGLSGTDKASSISWRSVLVEAQGEAPELYSSFTFSQRDDAAVADLPEVMLARAADSTQANMEGSLAGWHMTTAEPDAADELFTGSLGEILANCDGVTHVYTVEDTLTLVTSLEYGRARVELTDELLSFAAHAQKAIPQQFWN